MYFGILYIFVFRKTFVFKNIELQKLQLFEFDFGFLLNTSIVAIYSKLIYLYIVIIIFFNFVLYFSKNKCFVIEYSEINRNIEKKNIG